LDLVLDLNYFSFSNPNQTHLHKHQILTPNHQFLQRFLFVVANTVHAHMAWSEVSNFAWHRVRKFNSC